jgi:hypothetical protein
MNASFIILGFLCILSLIVLTVVGVLAMTLLGQSKSRKRYRDQGLENDNTQFETGRAIGMLSGDNTSQPKSIEDGFWLRTDAYALGSIIDYGCVLSGRSIRDSVVVETQPRQFVYTGDTPTDIKILNATPPDALESQNNYFPNPIENQNIRPSLIENPPEQEKPTTPESFEGYPPAY